jgi:hypothetical protein
MIRRARRRPSDGRFVVDVLPASLLAALGMALAYVPATIAAMSGAKPEESGLASGLVNTSYQIGSALGLARWSPSPPPGRRLWARPDRRSPERGVPGGVPRGGGARRRGGARHRLSARGAARGRAEGAPLHLAA